MKVLNCSLDSVEAHKHKLAFGENHRCKFQKLASFYAQKKLIFEFTKDHKSLTFQLYLCSGG